MSERMSTLRASSVLTLRDRDSAGYIREHMKRRKKKKGAVEPRTADSIETRIERAVVDGNVDSIETLVDEALAQGLEQRLVGRRERCGCLAALLLLRFQLAIFAQADLDLAFQQRPALFREYQRTVAALVGAEITLHDELSDHRPPGGPAELAADAVHRQTVVAILPDLVGVLAQQHVDHVRRAEALAGAVHRGQELLRRLDQREISLDAPAYHDSESTLVEMLSKRLEWQPFS